MCKFIVGLSLIVTIFILTPVIDLKTSLILWFISIAICFAGVDDIIKWSLDQKKRK